jgi:hypothetical protein
MAGGTVPSGVSVYSGTITAAGTAEVTTFADRYTAVVVTNTGPAGEIYATANGAVATGTDGLPIGSGQSSTIANGSQIWYQSSRVIPAGVPKIPTGGGSNSEVLTSTTVATSPAQPGRIHPFGSALTGGVPDDGTTVSIFTASGGTPATTYTITGAG